LLNKPSLILADEPTGNLDPATGEQIISHLYDIAKAGTAVVIATHNLDLLERFPGRVLRCEDKHLNIEE
jgi:cell division transport system ATP-binding protein